MGRGGNYSRVWDIFSEQVNVDEIESITELQQRLDDWLSPTVGKKNPEARMRAIEKLTEDFWPRLIERAETLPKRLGLELFPEEVEKRELLERAVERALRFPEEAYHQRFGAFWGTLSGALRKGLFTSEEVREAWLFVRGRLL